MRALTGREERIPGSGTQLVKKSDSFRFRTGRKKRCRRQMGLKKNNKKHNSVLLYNMCRCFPEVSVYSWPPACLPSGFKHGVVSIRGASLAAPQLNSDQFPSSRWRSVVHVADRRAHSDTFLLPAAAVSETGSEIPVTAFVSFWLSHLGEN